MIKFIKRHLPIISLSLAMAIILAPATAVYAAIDQNSTRYENYTASADVGNNITANIWVGQTFTTAATVPHTVETIRLRLYRVGTSVGTYDMYLYEVDGDNYPTGVPIGHSEYDADSMTTITSGTWYDFTMDETTVLTANTTYAIVGTAQSGDGDNQVYWMYDNGGGYSGGGEVYSTDSGTTWAATATDDYMFEVWGKPALQVINAKVFSGFLEDDDQLYVFTYNAMAPVAYTDASPLSYYNIQVVVNGTVEAQSKLPAWGYKPAAIYLDASEAQEWGASHVIRVAGITGGDFADNSASYTLQAVDWMGDDLELLDDWVLNTASDMESYYSTDLTSYVGGQQVLNETGGTVFVIGIAGLDNERPNLFEVLANMPPVEAQDHLTDYQDELTGNFGEGAEAAFEDIGDLIGVSGSFVGMGFGFYIVILCIGAMLAVTQSPVVASIVACPMLGVACYMGLIPLVAALVPAFILASFAIYKFAVRGV